MNSSASGSSSRTVPAPAPSSAAKRLRAWQDASVRERLLASGADPVGNSPEEFASLVRAEVAKWAKVVQAAGIKPE